MGLHLTIVALLTVCVFQCHAGVWDRIKNVFVPQEEAQPPQIRALVFRNEPATMLEVKGAFNVWDPYKNSKVSSKFSGKRDLIEARPLGLKWGEEFPGLYQLKIVPDHPDTRVVVNGTEYKGIVYLYDVNGKLCVINEVAIEDYLSSVLSGLFDRPLSKEAMNAIAIAARTDAYHHSTHSANPYWHVDAEKTGYYGYAVTKKRNGVDEAVESTKYMVLNLSTSYSGPKIETFHTQIVKNDAAPHSLSGASTVSVAKTEQMAQKGLPADKILTSIFPGSTISLIHAKPTQENKEVAIH